MIGEIIRIHLLTISGNFIYKTILTDLISILRKLYIEDTGECEIEFLEHEPLISEFTTTPS